MIVNTTKSHTILVLDDHYAVESSSSDGFYDRNDFKRDFGKLPFNFVYSPAWDDGARQYTVASALQAVAKTTPQGILLDVMFDRMTSNDSKSRLGVDILRELSCKHPEIPVVMMTSVPRNDLWTECSRLGAVDYLVKPISEKLLAQTLHRYVGVEMKFWLIGQNKYFLNALNLAAKAAEGKRSHILITGEMGTGKELIARYVHRHGRGVNTPFETLFLPTIPAELQPSKMFGHAKGSFTGATSNSTGAFRNADGGVVFLDELGEITSDAQTRLLRVAELGEVTRLGENLMCKVDVQIVSATNADLSKKMKENQFRPDLWDRLNDMLVALPSLEQRRDDIPLLVRHLLRCEALARKITIPNLPERLEGKLQSFPWPTNVRSLSKYVNRVFDLAANAEPNDEIFLAALPSSRPDNFDLGNKNPLMPPPVQQTTSAVTLDNLPNIISSLTFKHDDPKLEGVFPRLDQAMKVLEMRCLGAALEKNKRGNGDYEGKPALLYLMGDKEFKGTPYDELNKRLGKAVRSKVPPLSELKAIVDEWENSLKGSPSTS